MFKKLSIRNKLVISILIGCLIPYLIGSMYIKNMTEEWLYNNYIEHTNLLLRQTAEHVDGSILKNMHNLISIMALDTRLVNVDSNVNTYLDYDVNTFKPMTSESETNISEYLQTIKENEELVTLISFGTESGTYIEYPSFKPKGPYDPRERGWYLSAMNHNGSVISEPYITKMTKELVISVSKSVTKNDKKIAVISLTFKLNDLKNDIKGLRFGETGYINILNPNDVFISSPRHEEWVLETVDNLGLDVLRSIDQYNGKSFEGEIDNVDEVFNVYISPYSGWKYISVIDKSEVLEQSRALTDLLIVIFIITFLIILALILLISNYITKPILNIARVINKMATFKFDLYEHKNFKTYTHQKDEIGEISRALNGMQENFIELKSNIAVMDKEIQNINIDEGSVYQLNLSKDNPFSGITNSVNDLLKKVHSSIEQIKKFNDQITLKNELLISSEEKLKEQLEEIDTQKEYISYLADHDPLTNLPNRRKFHEKLSQVLMGDGVGAVFLLDLDNFKGINDTLGHLFGDKVLQHFSAKLQEMSNEFIFVSRFGGDEFLLLYECKAGIDEILPFIEQLFDLFSKTFLIEQNEVKVELSMGISTFPRDSQDMDQLIMNADLALYFIKNNGKNSYAFFDNKMADNLKSKLETKVILREAIANNGFKMVYQPQVDLHSGEIIGYEALIRLKHHNIPPAEFITAAEEDDMIITIGRIVTTMVVEQIHEWQEKGYKPKPVAINFSAVQIHDYHYQTYLLELLKENNVNPELIVIEITENIFLENKDTTIAFLNRLRAQGIKIAVDDFGTGYSSLSYLTFLPIDIIKLDRVLCTKFLELENIAVMDSLIALAHSLNLKVIAEGIEEKEHVKRLIVGKCDAVQGFYFSKPLEVEDVGKNYDKLYEL